MPFPTNPVYSPINQGVKLPFLAPRSYGGNRCVSQSQNGTFSERPQKDLYESCCEGIETFAPQQSSFQPTGKKTANKNGLIIEDWRIVPDRNASNRWRWKINRDIVSIETLAFSQVSRNSGNVYDTSPSNVFLISSYLYTLFLLLNKILWWNMQYAIPFICGH